MKLFFIEKKTWKVLSFTIGIIIVVIFAFLIYLEFKTPSTQDFYMILLKKILVISICYYLLILAYSIYLSKQVMDKYNLLRFILILLFILLPLSLLIKK